MSKIYQEYCSQLHSQMIYSYETLKQNKHIKKMYLDRPLQNF